MFKSELPTLAAGERMFLVSLGRPKQTAAACRKALELIDAQAARIQLLEAQLDVVRVDLERALDDNNRKKRQ